MLIYKYLLSLSYILFYIKNKTKHLIDILFLHFVLRHHYKMVFFYKLLTINIFLLFLLLLCLMRFVTRPQTAFVVESFGIALGIQLTFGKWIKTYWSQSWVLATDLCDKLPDLSASSFIFSFPHQSPHYRWDTFELSWHLIRWDDVCVFDSTDKKLNCYTPSSVTTTK